MPGFQAVRQAKPPKAGTQTRDRRVSADPRLISLSTVPPISSEEKEKRTRSTLFTRVILILCLATVKEFRGCQSGQICSRCVARLADGPTGDKCKQNLAVMEQCNGPVPSREIPRIGAENEIHSRFTSKHSNKPKASSIVEENDMNTASNCMYCLQQYLGSRRVVNLWIRARTPVFSDERVHDLLVQDLSSHRGGVGGIVDSESTLRSAGNPVNVALA
ncbi:hypothetical protein PoB_007278000 [Plakobranchus ocellatus]|uniref:Uncharacterized protein n=1 Tax=Plakobranchus ocellatus TaxID=259542 RepID=A0AAV4DQE3_9GAST|nr:hypothetical protein PoB_007278000 [Plakobranchus ocellatus]